MPLSCERGDLFATPGLCGLAHGCNVAGAMGAGIALAFRARWPAMFAEYQARCADGRFRLGEVFTWREAGVTVFNLGTQPHWRAHAELPAIASAVRAMLAEAETASLPEIALPRIGAGLGGLSWPVVLDVLGPLAQASRVRVRLCDEYIPGAPLGPLLETA